MIERKKVVVVTGAGSGIGEATAYLFGMEGYKVVLCEIDELSASKVKENIIDNGGEAVSYRLDVTDPVLVENVLKLIYKDCGAIDIIVNNAGIASKEMARTADHSLEDWDKVIKVNQSGVFYCMKYALKHMLEQGHGNIVNVASLAGLKASGFNIGYSASKFAVVGMTKSAALEYASLNIRINCVCPGYTRTKLFNDVLNSDPSLHDRFLKYIPMNRFGQPEEIAHSIFWLASDKTSFITGQAITMDGGLSL